MVKMKKSMCDLVIVGAGIAGLTLAKILSDKGASIHIIEPRPPKPFKKTSVSGRTVALMQSSINILKAANLDDFCTEYGTKMEIMRIYDDSIAGQDPIISEFEAFDLGLDYFSLNIPNDLLRAKLYEALKNSKNVTIHEKKSLESYHEDNGAAEVILDDGTTIKTSLIVGADGRGSTVRQLAGIKTSQKQYNQSAITLVINHSRAHNNTSTEFHRPGGPFAIVPMAGNQSSIVWVETKDKADALIKLPKDVFENTLQEATRNILGGITMETPPQSWPLCAIKAKSLIAPRVALIAEAAHVMSPITAQGLNLSLRDVATLAETIVDAMRLGQDFGNQTTLKDYAHRRSLDIETRTLGVNAINQLVSSDRAPVKDFRRIGLKMLDRFSPLKTLVMQHGLAPTLDQGRLSSGKAL